MAQFFVALTAFLVLHIVPSQAGIRHNLVARYGEKNYRIAYSVLSVVLIVWVISATLQAPYVALWQPLAWHFTFAIHLMPWSVIFLFAAFGTPNPLSVAFTAKPYDPANPGIVAITRHPVLWSFGLWGIAHIPANGDFVSLVFFAGMALFAFAGMKRIEAKKRNELGKARYDRLAQSTSVMPFLAILRGRTSFPLNPRMWLQILIG
ncbi:MAG: NnrU family protein, partial [Fimbriimonadaceae bacterium]|nr:NnrU family protein [Alphaproteobacteria bacterium]